MSSPRGIRLTEDEAWAALEEARVGIFTSLRSDGRPVTLPVWFAPIDRRIYLRSPSTSKKIGRVRADPRVSFLVESGERWTELRAVHLDGTARIVGDEPALLAELANELDRRYDPLRPRFSALGDEARDRYRGMTVIEITPTGRILSWDNARLSPEGGR